MRLFFCLLAVSLSSAIVSANPIVQSATAQCGQGGPYIDPRSRGGSMLDASAGLGEPLNVIISGFSSSDVLDATGKFYNYANAIGFSYECLGLHIGDPQQANLGDGRGWVNQTAVLRQDYGNSVIGTCGESLVGGNHFRVSIEEDAEEHHTIAPNGYDAGRDALVAAAVGEHEFDGVKYHTTSEHIYGLLSAGSQGINHNIAIDGTVVLLTVTIVN